MIKSRNRFSKVRMGLYLVVFAAVGGVVLYLSLAAPNPNLPGDLNGDNKVDGADLSFLAANYKTTNSAADINNSGTVDVADLSILLSHYGQTYSPTVPTVSLTPATATITAGQSVTLSWTSTNATSCSASWTTSTATSGSNAVTPSATTTYSITCTGTGGSATDSSVITVSASTAICGSRTGVPTKYNHVVWVWMENKSYDSVMGSGAASAPYINGLKAKCGF